MQYNYSVDQNRDTIMAALLFLVVVFLLFVSVEQTTAQSCSRITAADLGNTTTPSTDGLIAAILAMENFFMDEVQLIRYKRVCESTSGMRDGYRSVSLVAEYVINGTMVLSQFEFACMSATPGPDVWDIEVSGGTEDTVTTPPIATLNTTLRQDCYQCISPERDTSSSRTEHCLGMYVLLFPLPSCS